MFCTIPCPDEETEFKVVVKCPPRDIAMNAVLYVDGELCCSKCGESAGGTVGGESAGPYGGSTGAGASARGGGVRLFLDCIRVSTNEARPLIMKRIAYDGSRPQAAAADDTGVLRVDVWSGWRGPHSYDPILRYGSYVEYEGNRDLQRHVVPFNDCKGAFEITHKIDYGPVVLKPDRRHHFEKYQLLARFVYAYRDKAYISWNALPSTKKIRQQQTLKRKIKELATQGPIDISD
ncbi:hypothetical protein GNI_088430 [Gregarina niphandrodes]|uniref:Uncharacterized protein n=1 Tax=Gregarina niphandrodes TaxID=110365 RepID=A0A023B5Q0_GRENI|nr:hypothetical protein GNI_088430 [Gregarina niphandrodes]EZG61987.1 hypothetical protein GNI_088430 [Gregarina niphandrodes]|eukprot:XP_011130740.1 hypothetical protein GNI_088430 [Gregarina niphandrodes]